MENEVEIDTQPLLPQHEQSRQEQVNAETCFLLQNPGENGGIILQMKVPDNNDDDDDDDDDDDGDDQCDEVDFMDDGTLRRAVENAGRWAFGTIAVQVCVPNKDRTKLVEKGLWVDPAFALSQPSDALSRLSFKSRPDYVPPIPLAPGAGLGGALWADIDHASSSLFHNENRAIRWVDVNLLAIDPDRPYNERLRLLPEAGFGLAAGVPFNIRGCTGIVIFMARSTADLEKLQSSDNESYLYSAADMIGAILALQAPLNRVSNYRKKERQCAIRRVKLKILAIKSFNESLSKLKLAVPDVRPELEMETIWSRFRQWKIVTVQATKQRTIMWAKKCLGSNMIPPPPLPMNQAPFVFLGAFLQMLILATISAFLGEYSNGHETLMLTTLSSFAAMHYTLTAAPATQPRSGILATTFSCILGILSTYIPVLSSPVRMALVSALSIVLMAKFGCVHPPAAGTAISFSSGKLEWISFGILLLSYVVSIGVATAFNNLSETRQYPTFWGFGYVTRMCCSPKKERFVLCPNG